MTLSETPIAGAWLLEIQPVSDERGFFARSLCVDTLAAHGLEGRMQQQSVSFNQRRGTLRGMHLQSVAAPEPIVLPAAADQRRPVGDVRQDRLDLVVRASVRGGDADVAAEALRLPFAREVEVKD